MSSKPQQTPDGQPPWGERTKQAFGDVDRAPDWRTDAEQIRRKYGISPFQFDPEEKYQVYPDVIIHETDPEYTDTARGSNALVEGPKGSGKTTLALDWAHHQMDVNEERVFWRGDPRRSGWAPYRHWATVWLPASVDYTAHWMLEGEEGDGETLESVALEDEVRDVKRYEDVRDLLDRLGQEPRGSFHVIYPDPLFQGCEQITIESDAYDQVVPFVPKAYAGEDESATPVTHWWFAFMTERVENGPFQYHSLFFDELLDFVPENASNHGENAQTATKIRALKSTLAESRRKYFSFFGFGQEEEDLASAARRRFDWRVAMPGRPNPCNENNDSRVGFRKIPMDYDTMSGRDPGVGLVYNETEFNWFGWSDVKDPSLETTNGGRWLRIRFAESITEGSR